MQKLDRKLTRAELENEGVCYYPLQTPLINQQQLCGFILLSA